MGGGEGGGGGGGGGGNNYFKPNKSYGKYLMRQHIVLKFVQVY